MKSFFHTRNVLILFTISIVFIICIISFLRLTKNSIIAPSQYVREKIIESEKIDEETLLKTFWTKRIKERGPEKAYSELKGTQNQFNKSQHLAAHIFGEILYNEKGINGLPICDSIYAFGCFHGFFGEAISQRGLGIVEEANRVCIQKGGIKETGCRHGIGYGILEHLGSLSRDQLDKALDICKTIQVPSLLGCTQGVFMEYNFPAAEEIQRRQFDEKKSFTPCDTVASMYKSSCYFELGE